MESACLQSWLSEIFGYQLLQVGVADWLATAVSEASPIRCRCRVQSAASSGEGHCILAEAGLLPVATDSIDLVFLPHTLDFSPDPRQVLREVERVLIPGGRVVLAGFNPWSLWGLRRLLTLQKYRNLPWSGNFLGYVRLQDWLSLLGMEIERTDVVMFRPPFQGDGLLKRSAWLEETGKQWWPMLGGVYLVQATKRVMRVTPLRPRWQRFRRLGKRVLEPTTSGMPHG
ncbi:MAG: class I SAM-dependent methyltransferase [Pseudomonadota bacterium]